MNGNCACNAQSRHSCVNNNGAFMAQCNILRYEDAHVSLLQCEKGISVFYLVNFLVASVDCCTHVFTLDQEHHKLLSTIKYAA